MTWRSRIDEPHRAHWDLLEAAAREAPDGGPELPEGVADDELVLAALHAAQARGLLRLSADGGGLQLTPLGEAVEHHLVSLASCQLDAWRVAVCAVAETPGHEDPDAYFAALEGDGPPVPETSGSAFPADAARQIWALVEEMETARHAGQQAQVLVDAPGGGRAGVCWVPAGEAAAVETLPLSANVSEWGRPDGARSVYVPMPHLAVALIHAASERGLIELAQSEHGPIPVPAPGEQAVYDVLRSHHPDSTTRDDDGLLALLGRVLPDPA